MDVTENRQSPEEIAEAFRKFFRAQAAKMRAEGEHQRRRGHDKAADICAGWARDLDQQAEAQ